jgi:hypothetical protein
MEAKTKEDAMNHELRREQWWQEWRAQVEADRMYGMADKEYFQCPECEWYFNVYQHDECPHCGYEE